MVKLKKQYKNYTVMIITISGLAGSGKSSVAKLIAKKLGYEHFSAGDLQRELAIERGMSITQWGKAEAKDKSFDLMVDKKTEKLGKSKDNFVMDGWLAPLFIPHSVKIFLGGDELVRAKRRLAHKRKEENFEDIKKTVEDMNNRVQINQERWLKYYDYDLLDLENYDFIVDTTSFSLDEVVEKILWFVKDVKKSY